MWPSSVGLIRPSHDAPPASLAAHVPARRAVRSDARDEHLHRRRRRRSHSSSAHRQQPRRAMRCCCSGAASRAMPTTCLAPHPEGAGARAGHAAAPRAAARRRPPTSITSTCTAPAPRATISTGEPRRATVASVFGAAPPPAAPPRAPPVTRSAPPGRSRRSSARLLFGSAHARRGQHASTWIPSCRCVICARTAAAASPAS